MTPLLLDISLHPSWGESFSFILMGFILVIVVLGLLSLVTAVNGILFRRRASEPLATQGGAKPRSTPAKAKPASTDGGRLDPHLVAVITAAALTLTGPHGRVVSIRPRVSEWGREGRRQIFTSHKLR